MATNVNPILLLQDVNLTGAQNITRATAVTSYAPGVPVASSSNVGDAYPVLTAAEVTTDFALDVRAAQSGGAYAQGAWLWKPTVEADTAWRGVDHFSYWDKPHLVRNVTSRALASVFVRRTNRVLVVAAGTSSSSGTVTVNYAYRDVSSIPDNDSPVTWTTGTFSLTGGNGIAASSGDKAGTIAIAECPDGSLRLFVVTGSSTANDMDVYSSEDGLNWTIAAQNIVSRTRGSKEQIQFMRAAISGDFTRIVYATGVVGEQLQSYVSVDRGATWVEVQTDLSAVTADNGFTAAPFCTFDLCAATPSSGLFVLALAGTDEVNLRLARRTEDWTQPSYYVLAMSGTTIRSVAMARSSTYLYMVVSIYSSASGVVYSHTLRCITSEADDPSNWEQTASLPDYQYLMGGAGGGFRTSNYVPVCLSMTEVDAGMLLVASYYNPTSAAMVSSRIGGVYTQRWTQKSLYNNTNDNSEYLVDYQYDALGGLPDVGGISPWVQTLGASATVTQTDDYLLLESNNTSGSTAYYTVNEGTTPTNKWAAVTPGFYVGWVMRAVQGGSSSSDMIALRVRGRGLLGSQSIDVSFRYLYGATNTTVTVYDNLAGAVVTSFTVPSGVFYSYRFAMGAGLGVFSIPVSFAYCAETSTDGDWSTVNFDATIGTITDQRLDWGHLASSLGGKSRWKRVEYAENHYANQNTAYNNPEDQLPKDAASDPTYLYGGVYLEWTGGSMMEQDEWSLTALPLYGSSNLLTPSPSVQYVSQAATTAEVVLDCDPTYGVKKFVVDGVALFGTNARTIVAQVNDTDSWGAPSAALTLDATLVSGLTVQSVGTNSVTMQGTILTDGSPFPAGSLRNKYLWLTSGPSANRGFLIEQNVDSILTVATTTSIVPIIGAGNAAVIVDNKAAGFFPTRQQRRYLRVSWAGQTTTTGTYTLGAVVAGMTARFDNAAVAWEHTERDVNGVVVTEGYNGTRTAAQAAPPRRVIEATCIGDANGVRRAVSGLLKSQQGLSLRPFAFVWDTDDLPGSVLYVRWMGDFEFQDAGWRQDKNGAWMQVGDATLTFEEEL
jgi:hypothetical protein